MHHKTDKTHTHFKTVRLTHGYSLVELMLAMAISLIVMLAVVAVYAGYTRSYADRNAVSAIQQELRGVLAMLPMELRLAGCDPQESAFAGITEATPTLLRFTMDIRGNAPNSTRADGDTNDPGEQIAYTITARNVRNNSNIANPDINGDGIIDSGGGNWNWGNGVIPSLGREMGGAEGFQPLADNVEALEFNYILDNGNTTTTPNAAQLPRIQAVQISLLARSEQPSKDFMHQTRNNAGYVTGSGAIWNPPRDQFRRRMIVTTIQLRNTNLGTANENI